MVITYMRRYIGASYITQGSVSKSSNYYVQLHELRKPGHDRDVFASSRCISFSIHCKNYQ